LISNLLKVSIGLRNGLAQIWRQAICQSNDDKNLRCMDAVFEENELKATANIRKPAHEQKMWKAWGGPICAS